VKKKAEAAKLQESKVDPEAKKQKAATGKTALKVAQEPKQKAESMTEAELKAYIKEHNVKEGVRLRNKDKIMKVVADHMAKSQ